MPITGEGKTAADTEARPDLGPDHDHDGPISAMAALCESNFSRSLTLMASNKEAYQADVLRRLQVKFGDWAAYLGVFAVETASLDYRLKRHPQYHDLVLFVLDMLNSSLLQTLAEPEDEESDSSSEDEVDRREVELTGIQKSINELDRLAIYIRQSSISSVDARVKAFGARKPTEVASFETIAILAINGLYPDASEPLRQRLSKSMTQRYTRLLYWRSHDKKLRTDRRLLGQSRGDGLQTKLNPSHESVAEPPRQQRQFTKNDSSHQPTLGTSRVNRGTSWVTTPSNTGSHLAIPPTEGLMLRVRRTAATTVVRSGAKFPTPPKTEDGEYQKPCPYCRKIFSKADLADVGWWRKHVNGDLVPFVCLSSTCPEAPIFASRSEWITHMESDHGVFWSRRASIPNHPGAGHHDPEAKIVPAPHGLEDLCPLCSCVPVDKPGVVPTKSQRPTVDATKTLNPKKGTLPLVFEEIDLNESSQSPNNVKKSVRFEITHQDSEPAGESTSQLRGETESKKAANTAMLNHIADHLQFLALLAPRLSMEKLADGEVQVFSSALAISSDGLPGKRSTLDDEFETLGENESNILQDYTRLGMESKEQSQMPEAIPTTGDEDMEAGELVEWSDFSMESQTPSEKDPLIKHMQEMRTEYDRLLEAALSRLPPRGFVSCSEEAQRAVDRMAGKLGLLRDPDEVQVDTHIPPLQQENAISRGDLCDFFKGLFSFNGCDGDEILADYCTDQVLTARPHQDPRRRTEERLASRCRLFALLIVNQTPSRILGFIKEDVSDVAIPVPADTLRQCFPGFEDTDIQLLMRQQRFILSPLELSIINTDEFKPETSQPRMARKRWQRAIWVATATTRLRRLAAAKAADPQRDLGEVSSKAADVARDWMESPQSLVDDLYDHMVRSDYAQATSSYLPVQVVEKLIQHHVVHRELSRAKQPFVTTLVEYIVFRAKKLFVIAVLAELNPDKLLEVMEFFRDYGFEDSKLSAELPKHEVGSQQDEPSCLSRERLVALDPRLWRPARAHRICETQWQVLVPVISTAITDFYQFEDRTVLPFTRANANRSDLSGAFSRVHKVEIQPGHLDLTRSETETTGPKYFAVKELVPPDEMERQRTAESWANEVMALRTFSGNRGHIIRFIAAFTIGSIASAKTYNLIFEWADGGTLEDLFAREPEPELTGTLLKSAATQLAGLSRALQVIHEANIRHGDLKPRNLLCIEPTHDNLFGTLKIGDWGLAKHHSVDTALRQGNTTTRYGTILYEPPEVELQLSNILSRQYDVWSAGCVILETLIWVMYGYPSLLRFRRDVQGQSRESVPLYEIVITGRQVEATLRPIVVKWMDYMADEPVCEGAVPLAAILWFVRTRLLVTKLPPQSSQQVPNGGPYRATSSEVSALLKDMLNVEDRGEDFWTPRGARRPGPNFEMLPSTRHLTSGALSK